MVAIKPAPQRVVQSVSRQKRHGSQQEQRIPQKNDHRRKQVTLAGDVGLPGLEYLPCQRDVKGVGRPQQQMEPGQIRCPPVPQQIADDKDQHYQHGVKREEIRRQRDHEIVPRGDDVSARRGRFEPLDFAAKNPSPHGVRGFMAQDVNPHRFGQQEKDGDPASRAGQQRHPDS